MDLSLLGGFQLKVARRIVDLPDPGARVLAYLGLARDREVTRRNLAEALWPSRSDNRALANLRSTLWRLPSVAQPSITLRRRSLAMADDVRVDVDLLTADGSTVTPLDIDRLAAPLLPGWYDDWVVVERERLELRRIGVLERVARHYGRAGRLSDAIDIALSAIAGEPLRESLHRVVIEAHIAQGNFSEAVAQYERLDALLNDALGVGPSPPTVDLLTAIPVHAHVTPPWQNTLHDRRANIRNIIDSSQSVDRGRPAQSPADEDRQRRE